MKKFFIGCVAALTLVACNKDDKSAETQADGVSQDAAVDVAADATPVAEDATQVADVAQDVSLATDVSTDN